MFRRGCCFYLEFENCTVIIFNVSIISSFALFVKFLQIDGLIFPSAWLLHVFCIIAYSYIVAPLNINIWFLNENGRIFRIMSTSKWKIGKFIHDVNVRKNRLVFRIINRFLKFIPWENFQIQIKNFEKYFSFKFLDWHFWQNFYNFLKFS